MSRQNQNIHSALLFVDNPNVGVVIRGELKEFGVTDVFAARSPEEFMDLLMDHSDALMIIEWRDPPGDALKVLHMLQSPMRAEIRPIFLFARSEDPHLPNVAAEFNVSRIHTGELSRTHIQNHLEAIFSSEDIPQSLRGNLAAVSRSRETGQWGAAEEILKDLLFDRPDDVRVICELAENHLSTGKISDAAELLAGLAEDPKCHVRVLHLYGRCLMKLGRFDKATPVLQRARLFNPFNVKRLLLIGDAFMHRDRPGDAADVYREAVNLDPRSPAARAGLGKSLLRAGDFNEALQYLKGTTSSVEVAALFNSAGVIAVRDGRYEEGVELYKTAAKSLPADLPNMARLAFNTALAYLRWGKLTRSAYFFRLSFELDPKFDKAQRNDAIVRPKAAHVPEVELTTDPVASFSMAFDTTHEICVATNNVLAVMNKEDATECGDLA